MSKKPFYKCWWFWLIVSVAFLLCLGNVLLAHLKKDSKLIIEAKQIKGTIYYTEGCVSAERARFYSKQIADIFGFTDKIKIVVRDR